MPAPKVGRNGKPIKIVLPFEDAVRAALEVPPEAADKQKGNRRGTKDKNRSHRS